MKEIPSEDISVVAVVAEYKDEGQVYPAARLVAEYESFTPKYVASYLVCLYEIFERLVPENEQNSFQEETVAHFLDMLSTKDEYIEKFKTNSDDDLEEEED